TTVSVRSVFGDFAPHCPGMSQVRAPRFCRTCVVTLWSDRYKIVAGRRSGRDGGAICMARSWVKAHTRNGGPVRGHWRNPKPRKAAVTVALTIPLGGPVSFAPLRGGDMAPPRGKGGAEISVNQTRAKVEFDRVTVRLTAKGYKVNLHAKQDTDCVSHSRDRVQGFFRTNPCTSLERAYIELRNKRTGVILVDISRVDMPNAEAANRYKKLVDKPKPGTVPELSRESKRYRNLPFDDHMYSSGFDGPTAVWNSQVEPVTWLPARRVLEEIRAAARQ